MYLNISKEDKMRINISGLELKWKAKILKTIVNAMNKTLAAQFSYTLGARGLLDWEAKILDMASKMPEYRTADALTDLEDHGFVLDRIKGMPKNCKSVVPGALNIRINFNNDIIDTGLLEKNLTEVQKIAVLEALKAIIPPSRIVVVEQETQPQENLPPYTETATTTAEEEDNDSPPAYAVGNVAQNTYEPDILGDA
jgi:hypothetical protein